MQCPVLSGSHQWPIKRGDCFSKGQRLPPEQNGADCLPEYQRIPLRKGRGCCGGGDSLGLFGPIAELSGGSFGIESAEGKGRVIRASWLLSGNN